MVNLFPKIQYLIFENYTKWKTGMALFQFGTPKRQKYFKRGPVLLDFFSLIRYGKFAMNRTVSTKTTRDHKTVKVICVYLCLCFYDSYFFVAQIFAWNFTTKPPP